MIDPIRAEEAAVPVFMPQTAQQTAQQFARQQPSPAKAQQVQLNTLAVCAVNNYFKILGIPSDPSGCDSWNPFMRMTTNVADLEICGRGRIECRPLLPSNQAAQLAVCYVPTEVQGDRLAYIVVQIEPEQSEALILGFAEQVQGETLPLSRLRPMSELPDYLEQTSPITRLAQWVQGEVDAGWTLLDELLGATRLGPQLNYHWRSTPSNPSPDEDQSLIARGKVVYISTSWGRESVALVVEVSPSDGGELSVELKTLPIQEQAFLPTGLKMTVLDAEGDPVMHAQARDENRTIELGFHAESGDRFTLRLEVDDGAIDEHFTL